MTDTCSAAQKFQRLLIEAITEISKKKEMKSNKIKIFEAGKLYNIILHDLQMKTLMKDCYYFVLMYKECWNHLRNFWFGAVINKLCARLDELLEEDIEEIQYSLRVTTDIGNLLHAIEKYFGGTANYAKEKGYMFMDYMRRYHPTSYLYPVSRACGGSRQEIGVEGAVSVLMNTPH